MFLLLVLMFGNKSDGGKCNFLLIIDTHVEIRNNTKLHLVGEFEL